MGSKSNYLENSVLQWGLTATVVTRPPAWYVGLFTDAAGSFASTDQPVLEANSTNCPGYTARPQVNGWTISGTNPTQALNNNAVTFTATGPWTTVNYFGIFDSATPGAGNLLYFGTITPKTLANTDQLQFGISQITITED